MKKRLIGALLVLALSLSLALPALADDVTTAVYGLPSCATGQVLGAKGCVPVDVVKTSFAASAIVNVVQSGIMVGDATGNFNPDKKLTAGESATIMLKVLGLKPEPSTTGHWATGAMNTAASLGLTNAGQDPEAPMTRAGMALLIAKALHIAPLDPKTSKVKPFTDMGDVDAETQGILLALRAAGVFAGYPDGSFAPDKALSRAEMAMLVQRILAKFAKP